MSFFRVEAGRIGSIVISCGFLLLIFTSPLLMLFTPQAQWSFNENRALATVPDFPHDWDQWQHFSEGVENYFSDNFGYREWLIGRYNRELKKRFNKGLTSKVLVAEEGWLYFTGDDLLEDYLGDRVVPDEKLDILIETWAEREKRFAALGISYLVVIAPNKQTVYPEFLPPQFFEKKGTTVLERLRRRIMQAGTPPGYWLDLLPELLPEKTKHRIYQKTDTHWNKHGGYNAYQQIMNRLSVRFPDQIFSNRFKYIKDEPGKGGDLAKMIMADDEYIEIRPKYEAVPVCAEKTPGTTYLPTVYHTAKQGAGENRSILTTCGDATLKALVFRDSFSIAIIPFLAENFSTAIFAWQRYDPLVVEEAIIKYQPDIIIEEINERMLFLD